MHLAVQTLDGTQNNRGAVREHRPAPDRNASMTTSGVRVERLEGCIDSRLSSRRSRESPGRVGG